MITVLADVIAPNSLFSAGVTGKQIRRNIRTEVASGAMMINRGWSTTLRQFTIGTVPLRVDQWQTLEALYEVTQAGALGFLVMDPKDSSATNTTGKVTLIDAPSHTYQLTKRYTPPISSSRFHDRNITRPRASGFILTVSGTPTGSYTLDVDTGIITIPADPAEAAVVWSGSFYVPVHFENDDIDWELQVAGQADARFLAGPSVVLTEIKE